MRIRFTETGRGGRYVQRLKATRQLTGLGLKGAHRIVNAREWFECDGDEARALLDGYGVPYEVDNAPPATTTLTPDEIAEALAVMTGATVCDARRELAAAVARLAEMAAYPAPAGEGVGR